MWVSIRETFRQGDPGWINYIRFIQLPALQEVRTIDMSLNAPDGDPIFVANRDQLDATIADLPAFNAMEYYIQLAINCAEKPPLETFLPTITLLGYDIADATQISSVLNCGPWDGQLLPFTTRLNRYGLLTYEDALRAQALLPTAWDDDLHAFGDVWAIYTVSRR